MAHIFDSNHATTQFILNPWDTFGRTAACHDGTRRRHYLCLWCDVGLYKLLNLQASSPACTELETIVMDWLAKAIGLPSIFYHSNKDTQGGGVIQVISDSVSWWQWGHCFPFRFLEFQLVEKFSFKNKKNLSLEPGVFVFGLFGRISGQSNIPSTHSLLCRKLAAVAYVKNAFFSPKLSATQLCRLGQCM